MDLRQLEYFVAVAEEANFTRAAERVHISQSGVSAQIRALEHELGMPLIDRSARRAALTPAGAAALPHARAALAAADAVRKAVDEVAGVTRGALAVGMVSGCTVTPFFDALASFHRAHPGVALRLFEDDSARLLAQVRSGRADLALVGVPDGVPAGLRGLPVTAEGLVAAVPEGHPLARRQRTTLGELLTHDLVCMPPGTGIRAVLDRACAEQGLHPEITLEAGAPAAVADLARLGLGVGVLSESMVRPPLVAVPITDVRGPAVLALVWSTAPNPALDRLTAELRRAFGTRQAHSGEDGDEE